MCVRAGTCGARNGRMIARNPEPMARRPPELGRHATPGPPPLALTLLGPRAAYSAFMDLLGTGAARHGRTSGNQWAHLGGDPRASQGDPRATNGRTSPAGRLSNARHKRQ